MGYYVSGTIVLVVVLTSAFWLLWRSLPDYSPLRHVQELYVPAAAERLYISFEEWGVTYDRQVVTISTTAKGRTDYRADEDYAFHTADSPILYSIHGDTLLLYTVRLSPIPERFASKIQIRQVLVDHQRLLEMERNHEQLGLTKVGGPDYRMPTS